MDAREALGQHQRAGPGTAARARRARGWSPGRSCGPRRRRARLAGRLRRARAHGQVASIALEANPADRLRVAAEGQRARSGRQDLVGRDVVADLEQHRQDQVLPASGTNREASRCSALSPGGPPAPRAPGRGATSIAGQARPLRVARRAGNSMAQRARIGDDARERRRGRRLRADEIDLVLAVPLRPGKLRGTVRRLMRSVAGRLPHADAAVAARLMHARAGADERAEVRRRECRFSQDLRATWG